MAELFTTPKQEWYESNRQGVINIEIDEVSDKYLEKYDGVATVFYDMNKEDLSQLIEALESGGDYR